MDGGVISGSTARSAATPTSASFSDPTSISGTIPTNGIGIAVINVGASITASWTNGTQDGAYSRSGGLQNYYTGHTATGTGASVSVSVAGGGGNQNHMVMGIFGP